MRRRDMVDLNEILVPLENENISNHKKERLFDWSLSYSNYYADFFKLGDRYAAFVKSSLWEGELTILVWSEQKDDWVSFPITLPVYKKLRTRYEDKFVEEEEE